MTTKWMPAHQNNFERTRSGERIELIILHWSSGESLAQTDSKFTDPNRLASAHLAIENHEIHQYVKDDAIAFHAGSSSVNLKSIGIICIGGPNMPISDATYQTLSLTIEELCRKYRIPIDVDHIKGHKDIAKGYCPGTLDIQRVIKEAKELSPQSIMDKLRADKEDLQNQLLNATKKVDTADARIEEVRNIVQKQEKKLEGFIIENHKLREYIDYLSNRSVFAILKERIKKKFHAR